MPSKRGHFCLGDSSKWHDTRPRNRADTPSWFSLLVLHSLGEFLRSNVQSNAADEGWSSFFWFALIPEITSAHLKKAKAGHFIKSIGSSVLAADRGIKMIVFSRCNE